jgi:hypothetical protein
MRLIIDILLVWFIFVPCLGFAFILVFDLWFPRTAAKLCKTIDDWLYNLMFR